MMVIIRRLPLSVFSILAYLVNTISGVSPPLGNAFVIALPGIDDLTIHCILSTLTSTVEVNILAHSDDDSLMANVYVSRFKGYVLDIVSHNIKTVGIVVAYGLYGNGTFGLIVMMSLRGEILLDAFQALPVEGWGNKYYILTTEYMPVISIVTFDDNNFVKFRFKEPRPDVFKGSPMYTLISDSGELSVVIDNWQGFTISACNSSYRKIKSLSGTVIEGTYPIGVIVGACYIVPDGCGSKGRHPRLALAMLMPTDTYGTEFIPVGLDALHIAGGRLQALTWDDNTTINYTTALGSHRVHLVEFVNFSRTAVFFRYQTASRLTSNKAIQLVYLHDSQCFHAGINMSYTLCVIVPLELFYDVYTWRLPHLHNKSFPVNFYASLVIEQKSINRLRINEIELDSSPLDVLTVMYRTNVVGKEGWLVMHLRLLLTDYSIYHEDAVKFGCYLFGRGNNSLFHMPAGFVSSNINTKCSKTWPPLPDDVIDNDCDGLVDEELMDGKDNDKDNYIDEDLMKHTRVNGEWSEWSSWECSRNCSDIRKFRTRECNNPAPNFDGLQCVNENKQSMPSDCYMDSLCPALCPQGSWALNCVSTCYNCVPDCDKFTGQCSECEPGYKDPQASCTEGCDRYTYGINCSGDCWERCHSDCYDRVTGACIEMSWEWINYLLLIPLVLFLWMIAWSSRSCFGKCKWSSSRAAEIEHDSSTVGSTEDTFQRPFPYELESSPSTLRKPSSMKVRAESAARVSTNIDNGHCDLDRVAPHGILTKSYLITDSRSSLPRLKKSVSFAEPQPSPLAKFS